MKPATPAKETVRAENKPSILRRAPGESLGRLVTQAAMNRSLADAQLYVEQSSLKAAAWRPIVELIRGDGAAAEALERVRRVVQQRARPQAVPNVGSRLLDWHVRIGPGYSVFTTPYDHAQVGPNTGAPEQGSSVDVLTGTFHVDADMARKAHDWDGAFFAIAGLGLDLETRVDGALDVRVPAQISYFGEAYGAFLDSNVEGHVTIRVLDVTTQTQATAPTDYRLFAQSNDGNVSDDLMLGGDYLSVGFPARAGTAYQIWITASVAGAQSGWSRTFGPGSGAGGSIDVTVPFVVAELR